MINSKKAVIELAVDNYINITDFSKLNYDDIDPYLIAAIVGCIEGVIQINKEESYITFIDMYKINCSGDYKFFNIYNLIKKHKDYYNYIVKYFNLWHGNDSKEFTYDEYHKNDLSNNFFEIVSLMIEEKIIAIENNNQDVIHMYSNLSEYGKYYRKIELIN